MKLEKFEKKLMQLLIKRIGDVPCLTDVSEWFVIEVKGRYKDKIVTVMSLVNCPRFENSLTFTARVDTYEEAFSELLVNIESYFKEYNSVKKDKNKLKTNKGLEDE